MIDFVKTNSDEIFNNVLSIIETELGETLAEGDERKLFIRSLMPIIVAINNDINDTANQNLLEFARDDKLDTIAKEYHNTERLKPTESVCNGVVKLSELQSKQIIIPSGTKVTPDGIAMFKVKENVVIPSGEIQSDLKLIAASTGDKYNGYKIGSINRLVDPIPYISEIYNTEISNSGSDIESNESFRERARLELESESIAGPTGAYEYLAYSSDNSISAVKVISPSPGTVKILATVDNGEIPSKDILDKILNKCSARDVRPLTDNVITGVPEVINYDIDLTYYLDKNLSTYERKWRKSIEGNNLDFKDGAIRDFILWQQDDIGKSINPDELRYKIQDAASYEVENKRISGVRRILMTSPKYLELTEEQLAKVKNININYGGME
ncbi:MULTISPECIES: baseplate J/gp47 family protein [unclassified Clostridium]|uniref:baseplate J/gp47 family protein n=1 Tax=unclassified Clostridium TaxID=2614128 RepID=UPI002079CC01|nr:MULTISPECIES: baseplate J/gp47 family protein [unclassified Clostridium]